VKEKLLKKEIGHEFRLFCEQAGRQGVIGFVPVENVRLLPVQSAYLQRKLDGLGPALSPALSTAEGEAEGPWSDITAVSVGLLYHQPEVLAIPAGWVGKPPEDGQWNRYARAYTELNRLLNEIATRLAEQFHGVAEQATIQGWVEKASHVNDYFPACVSHRAFAEAGGVGWGPEAGPALRFATVFIPQPLPPDDKYLPGCGDCSACLEVCSILRPEEGYRERCRRRIEALGLEDEVCGICVRTCWEAVIGADDG
jgi:hypothetical protein